MAASETFARMLLVGDPWLTRSTIIRSGHDHANDCAFSFGAFALAISQLSLRQQVQELRGAVDVFRLA